MSNKDIKTTVRSTEQERTAWETAAKADGRTLSNWVCWVLNREADKGAKK